MYYVADMNRWQGRVDAAEGPAGRRWHQVVEPLRADSPPGIALVGFASDAGVARNHGRAGARKGPQAIRAMLGNMPVRHVAHIFDAGDVVCEPQADGDGLETAQHELSTTLAGLLEHRMLPITLGGGHEMAFGSFGGLAGHIAARPAGSPPRIGIVNLDAHFDLRLDTRASSGTPFRQIAEDCQARGWPFHYCCMGVSAFANTQALFERADELGVRWRADEDMDITQRAAALAQLAGFLDEVDDVYFTICLDVLPGWIAPGVSAPAACGVPLDVIEPLVDLVAASGKLRLADIAELNPDHDIDNRTARVAARLVARLVERLAAGA